MIDTPDTKYAPSSRGRIAYQEFGTGPVKLLYTPGTFNNLDFMWSDPGYTRFLRQLSQIAHVVAFDRLGVGLSDRVSSVPPLEERALEIEAVLDAVGFERASILAASENAAAAAFFSATQSHRVSSLVLCGALFKGVSEELPWSLPVSTFRRLKALAFNWGNGGSIEFVAPSVAGSRAIRKLWGVFERAVASPGEVEQYIEFIWDLDNTAVVSSIDVPTLIVARKGDRICPIEQSRKLAELVPNSQLVELEGEDHVPWFGDLDAYLDPVEKFLTGAITDRQSTMRMATLLMTDIVDSTDRLSRVGDQAWSKQIVDHDEICREVIQTYGGEVIDRLGDGFLSAFRGPRNAAECALKIVETLKARGIEIRAGLHAGKVVLVDHYMQGMTVNMCARICAAAGAGEILASKTVYELLPRLVEVRAVGMHELKGIGEHQLFRVERVLDGASIEAVHQSVGMLDAVTRSLVRHLPFAARGLMKTLRGLEAFRWRGGRAAV